MKATGAVFLFFAACFTLLLSWALPSDCNGQLNRCKKYRAQVIREARAYIGMDAPYHYFMGQIEQESHCNEKVTAFDGGMGLGQFMPATAKWIHDRENALQEISVKPTPYDPRWNIRALVLYDKYLYGTGICKGWYFAFSSYNGGQGNLNKEIRRAGRCEISLVEQQCARKVIKLKSGSLLDFCRVNIEYPYLIYKKGEKYK